jgi:hypothetical protein
MTEPTITIQLTQEQIEDVLGDLALGGFSTTFSTVLAALPADIQEELHRKWEKEDEDEEDSWSPAWGDAPDLGPCCACEKRGPDVRNIICLHKLAPVPGTGWGCFQCGLPMNGAIVVLCDDCLERNQKPRFVCDGRAGEGKRLPIGQLSADPFEHDMSKHPEAAEP